MHQCPTSHRNPHTATDASRPARATTTHNAVMPRTALRNNARNPANPVNTVTLLSAVDRELARLGQPQLPRLCLAIDCRDFRDPGPRGWQERAREEAKALPANTFLEHGGPFAAHSAIDTTGLTRHCGTHPQILWNVAHSDVFPTWLLRQRRRIHALCQEAERDQERGVALILYCKSGKHRAVACGTLLGHAMLHHDEQEVAAMVHLTDHHRFCQCGVCAQCTQPHYKGGDALRMAASMWAAPAP